MRPFGLLESSLSDQFKVPLLTLQRNLCLLFDIPVIETPLPTTVPWLPCSIAIGYLVKSFYVTKATCHLPGVVCVPQ